MSIIVLNIGQYVRLGIWRLRYRYLPYRIGRYAQKVKKLTTDAPNSRDVSFDTLVSDTTILVSDRFGVVPSGRFFLFFQIFRSNVKIEWTAEIFFLDLR